VPGDEVPDPRTEGGRQLQEIGREQDMATTVRETDESNDENGNHFKTLYMVDGSKQLIKEEGGWPPSAHVLPEGTLQVTHTTRTAMKCQLRRRFTVRMALRRRTSGGPTGRRS
jgi:hypothetical protein